MYELTYVDPQSRISGFIISSGVTVHGSHSGMKLFKSSEALNLINNSKTKALPTVAAAINGVLFKFHIEFSCQNM